MDFCSVMNINKATAYDNFLISNCDMTSFFDGYPAIKYNMASGLTTNSKVCAYLEMQS